MNKSIAGKLLLLVIVIPALMSLAVVTGCSKGESEAPKPPVVEVTKVIQRDVPIYREWIGTLDGMVNATIRAQVQGYLIKQNYREGDFVKKGQILFEIDPRTFQAALEHAKGQLESQQARWTVAKANLARVKPLAEKNAVSKKDLDDSIGMEQSARAAVISAQATVDKAQLDLGFTRIISPVDGIAGLAKAQIGDLVTPGGTEALTTVSTVQPIKAYIQVSEQEYLQSGVNAGRRLDKLQVELILSDGTKYPHTGVFGFADRQVDVNTGTIRVTAIFPNPNNFLRPGQYGRVRVERSSKKDALLVPQRSVAEIQGKYMVAVVGSDSKVDIRPVKAADRIDSLWIISEGLKPGETVIVEGIMKVKPGMTVATKQFVLPPASGPAPAGGPDPAKPDAKPAEMKPQDSSKATEPGKSEKR